VCNCELCALPDDLSDALDTKIESVNKAAKYLDRFCLGQERDGVHAIQLLDMLMTTIIKERLFFDYSRFFLPLQLFTFFGNVTLLQQVGQATLSVLRRYLGTGISAAGGDAGIEYVSSYIKQSLRHIADSTTHAYRSVNTAHALNAQLKKTASNIISNLQSLP
jgi:hypothetical protein